MWMCVLKATILTLPYKREVWRAIKPGSTQHYFLKMSWTKSGISSCYQIVHFYVCCIGVCFCCTSVFLLFPCFPLIADVFPSVLVYYPFNFCFLLIDLWLLNRVYYCCHYQSISSLFVNCYLWTFYQ